MKTLLSFSDPETIVFRNEVREWLAASLPIDWRTQELQLSEDEMMEIRRDWDRTLFVAGYAGLSWPERFGGRELGPVAETVFSEELALAHAPEPLGRIGRMGAGPMVMRFGSEDQQARYLSKILDGSEIWCLGYSEPANGSDLGATSTLALREEDGDVYRVTGRKIWTSYAHYADRCMLLAKTSKDGPRGHNLSMMVLDMHQPGIDISPIITAAGDHHFNEVSFDGALVPVSDRLGPEHEGLRVFKESLAFERGIGTALNYYIEMCREIDVLTSCCARSYDDSSAMTRAMSLRDQTELIRWHIMQTVELEMSTRSSESALLILKLWWSEFWQEITEFGLFLGCRSHVNFWRYQYLQSRPATIYAGTSEIQRNTIARYVLSS